MTESELSELLSLGREQRAVEFKGPGPSSDKPLAAKVIRAMMAMANLRDGGHVVVGVQEADGSLLVPGLDQDAARSWTGDDFRDRVDAYADPFVEFDVERVPHGGVNVVVIRVHEFHEIPVICRKSYASELSEGALYVRSTRKPESIPVRTAADMRDVVERATTKSLRGLVARLSEVGVRLERQDTSKAFDAQLEGLE